MLLLGTLITTMGKQTKRNKLRVRQVTLAKLNTEYTKRY